MLGGMGHPTAAKGDEHMRRRRAAIDELHFVYIKLGHLLTALTRRVSLQDLGHLLTTQHRMGRMIDDRLQRTAFEHGIPARPCVCQEAADLVEKVYHAERSAVRDDRPRAIIAGLLELRGFLLRTWQDLIALSAEGIPEPRDKAVALQPQEGELRRELVEMERRTAA